MRTGRLAFITICLSSWLLLGAVTGLIIPGLLIPGPVMAQTASPQPAPSAPPPPNYSDAGREMGLDVNAKLTEWTRELDRIDNSLNDNKLRYRDLDRHRERLDQLRGEMNGFADSVRPKVDGLRAQVESLGPAPAKDAPPEPEAVARQRADWNATLGSLTVSQNATEAARVRAGQLANKIQDIRRRRFTQRLFERVPEAHAPETWMNAPGQTLYSLVQAGQAVANWWMLHDQPEDVYLILAVTVLVALALTFVAGIGVRRVRVWNGPGEPPFWRRGSVAAWLILLRAVPPAASIGFLYFALHGQELMSVDVDRLAYSAMRSVLIVAAVLSLATTALAPGHPQWRLIAASERSATLITWLVGALAVIYSASLLLGTVRSVAFAPIGVIVVQSAIASIAIALLVIAILRTRLESLPIEGAQEVKWLRALRVPLWGAAVLILLAAMGGYIPLARFLSAQLIVTGTILAIVYLIMIWIDAFGQGVSDENAVTGRWLIETLGLEKRRCEQFALPTTLGLKLAVLMLSVPLILLQWGFDWKDIAEWSRDLFMGFRIGNTQISIAAILASLMVFGLGYAAARLFQGWLDRQVLEPAGISGSVRHSISTGVGYVGVIAAAMFAVSYAGLDLSNIALIAGALSVGIGLGLQGVVNNFVSGLILLVERPIKVGDWVVVGGEEGLVRRISVRSTEIETFDRANVLVPNSYFISESVKNWTLHNYSGRIIIPVSVDFNSDPRKVREMLADVAKANPNVMTNPEPFVLLDSFGNDTLQFKLFAYVYDVTKGGGVRTDLQIAIIEALREHRVAAPIHVTEVNLRKMELLARSLETRREPVARRPRRRRRLEHAPGANGNGRTRPQT